jgi:hypothetical protein
VAPPASISGLVAKNIFATQTDIIHIVSWTASPDSSVVSYNVYRNGVLIGVVPATSPLKYFDHNRYPKVPDTYSVTAVNGSGQQSTPVVITIP